MQVQAVATLVADLGKTYPFLSDAHAKRIAHAYGTRAQTMLAGATSLADLGQDFGGTLTEREVRYLMTNEWALTAEDIVWRRSKLGLRMSAAEIAALDAWITAHRERAAVTAREAGGRA